MVAGDGQIVVAHQLGVLDIQVQLVQQRVRILGRVLVQGRRGVRLSRDQPAHRRDRVARDDQGERAERLLPSGLHVVAGLERGTSSDHRNRQFAEPYVYTDDTREVAVYQGNTLSNIYIYLFFILFFKRIFTIRTKMLTYNK